MGCKRSPVVVLCALLVSIGTTAATTSTTLIPPTAPTTVAPTTAPPTPPTPPTTPPTPPTTTSTSTVAPTSPPPPPVTSTAAPPSDERGNWTISNGNVTCIMAQMVVSVKIPYPTNTPNQTLTKELLVPSVADASGRCDVNSQSMKIIWGSNNLNITFGKNDTTKMFFVNHIDLSVLADNKTFPNISTELLNHDMHFESHSIEFKTTLNQSYRCIREESLPLSKPNSTHNDAVLILNKVQLQAFHEKEDAVFETPQDCELDTPDVVPIAVGCALAGLVFVVLVAYLVGRRRSQARGYLSM